MKQNGMRRVIRLDYGINDEAFAGAIVEAF